MQTLTGLNFSLVLVYSQVFHKFVALPSLIIYSYYFLGDAFIGRSDGINGNHGVLLIQDMLCLRLYFCRKRSTEILEVYETAKQKT